MSRMPSVRQYRVCSREAAVSQIHNLAEDGRKRRMNLMDTTAKLLYLLNPQIVRGYQGAFEGQYTTCHRQT